MRVVISAGGTGGHIYPALAIVDKIKEKEPNSEFLYIGTHNRMEKDVIPKRGIKYVPIKIYGFSKNIFKDIKNVFLFLVAIKKCKKIINDFNPDVVIGTGGYVTLPVILASYKKYKTVIHEQNSVLGKTNKFLAKKVDLVLTSFSSTLNGLEKNVIFTGNPCSESAKNVKASEKVEFNLSKDKKLVYIVMGSLGSQKINTILNEALALFKDKEYEVLFITGENYYDQFKDKKYKNVFILPYIDKQTRILKKTDVLVTRSGATTLSEIIALNIPSILIPSPYVTNNHQHQNALELVNNNAAILIEEKNLTKENLVNEIDELINNKKKQDTIKSNLRHLFIDGSATKAYEEIKRIISGK
jgi:UDP-N-acetylglucosamine--N-acetylmuramyl-(pentapeptide) pyrophosphoryl-undecaprenol N-acetylglucosamine transferase